MNILVLGGTRFIGAATVKRLVNAGHSVAVFHRGKTRNNLAPAHEIIGDRQDLPQFASAFQRFAPELVLDMFPITEHDARVFMSLFKGLAERVISISSIDVYRAYGRLTGTEPGSPEPTPLTEDSPLREKLYPYRGKIERLNDYDKILVERVVMSERGLPGTVLRLPMVYGPHDYQHRLFPYLKRMDDRRPAILLEKTFSTWRSARGFVENMARAIELAVTHPGAANRIYHVAEPLGLTEAEWVAQIGQATGWQGRSAILPAVRMPAHLQDDGEYAQHLDVDSSRIRRELGYTEIVPLDAALRQTIEWERAEPPSFDVAQFDYPAEEEALAGLE